MNPKDAQAQAESKVRLDLLEPVGNEACARALEFGAITKGYGVQNYLQVPISARTYLAAAQRHLDALKQCEDLAPDSLIHHWGHILANGHIWLAALEAGTLVDDRGPGEVGPHPINSTEPSEQASKGMFSARTLEEAAAELRERQHARITEFLDEAEGIVDQIGTLVDREDEGLLPKPTARSHEDRLKWATAEEKEKFWQDIGRPVDPPLGPGSRVRVKATCTFRSSMTGEILEEASSAIPGRDWKVRFDLDGLEFYFSGYELERAPEEPEPAPVRIPIEEDGRCGGPGGCTTCTSFKEAAS